MIGIIIALTAALSWAASSIILKYLSGKVATTRINAIRLWIGSIILFVFIAVSGRIDALFHSGPSAVIAVVVSGIVGIAIGDTIYIKSLSFLDVSRAYPIAQCTFPVVVLLAAVWFLDESFTRINIFGGIFVLLGVLLITRTGRKEINKGASVKGIALALMAAIAWAAGSVALKVGASGLDSFVAAAMRIPAATVILSGVVFSQLVRTPSPLPVYSRNTVLLLICTGILTYGIGAVCYVSAIQQLGVGKTVLLTAVSPLFLLPLSTAILKERPSLSALAGGLVCVSGVCLVAL
jgi:drug/metabolite transporter, DME family